MGDWGWCPFPCAGLGSTKINEAVPEIQGDTREKGTDNVNTTRREEFTPVISIQGVADQPGGRGQL